MDKTQLIQVILPILGVTIGYLTARKKNSAEIRRIDAAATFNELEATEKAVAIWRGLAEEFRKEVEQLRELVNELREEIDELKSQNVALSEEMRIYKSKENA